MSRADGPAPGVRRHRRVGVAVTPEAPPGGRAAAWVRGLPDDVDTGTRRWILTGHASVERVVEVVGRRATRAPGTELPGAGRG